MDKAQTGILAATTKSVLAKKTAAILSKTNTGARMEKGPAAQTTTVLVR